MSILTMDNLVAALGTSQDQKLFFPSATNVAAGLINLNQAVTGGFGIMAAPAAIASGGTAFSQSNFSTGFPRWTANGATKTYVGRWGSTLATVGTLHLYDLLFAASGFSGASASAQTITSPAALPTRNSTGSGAELWIGCSSAIGATAHNVTVQYTNQANTSGRNSVSTAGIASMPANRLYQVPLQSGDTGIKSVQGLTLSVSSGTAGNLWVLVMNRIASLAGTVANVGITLDFAQLALPNIDDESCLVFVNQGSTTSSGVIMGQMSVLQG